jgi:hypothetical protein
MVNIYTQQILKILGTDNEKLNLHSSFVQQGVNRLEALIHDLLTLPPARHSFAQVRRRSCGAIPGTPAASA